MKKKITQSILLALVFLVLTFCSHPTKNKEQAFYTNPVIKGDFPDPSIILVGDTYYAAGTSNDFVPNYPIYESKDLINWERVSSVFNEPPEWSSEDFWAPELFYHNGTYFVYYTTKRKDNGIACIGVATTKNIHDGFTDHGIIIEWGEEAIDAFVFHDDDGKLYITWKAYGLTKGRDIEILGSELSDDGLHLIGEHFTLTDHTKGWFGAGDEGQCIVKRNGYYYMLYSVGGCCDNRCDYRVRVSRSKDLKSGWEQFPQPILYGGDEWRCPGHGTLVTTPNDRYFYMFHSYNVTDFEYIGRQGMLGEMLWNDSTNWPYFKSSTPTVSAEVPFENTTQNKDSVFVDDFSSDKNLAFWEWDVIGQKPNAEVKNENLVITSPEDGINFLGFRPETGDYEMTAEVTQSSKSTGIGIYGRRDDVLVLAANQSEIILYQIDNGEKEILATETSDTKGTVHLKYKAEDGRHYQFFWSKNGTDWFPIFTKSRSAVDAKFLTQWGYSPRAGFILEGKAGDKFYYNKIEINYIYKY